VLGPVTGVAAPVLPSVDVWVATPSVGSTGVGTVATQSAPAAVATEAAPAAAATQAAPVSPRTQLPATTHQGDDAAPLWTSSTLIGHDAPAQLATLAAAVGTRAQATPKAAVPASGGGGSTPGTPTPGSPCNAGLGAAGPGGGLSSGSWAALGVTPAACRPATTLEPHPPSPALWRPTVFISLQERPG
jgi:hypothetical protein